jgi:dihydropteroate synthase
MGVLNVTPDSFGDARHLTIDEAIDAGARMEADGADLIDIGGESTRPGAMPIAPDEEARRVLPVVRALAARVRIPLSVDTYKANLARMAIAEGATVVNDVSGLLYEPMLARVVADSGAALVVMHMRGRSHDMYANAQYGDVAADVSSELSRRVETALTAGVPRDRLIVDPGIGFAKRPAHSYGVLARLPEIARALDRPLLVGPSRKSFMSAALDGRPAPERDWGTAAAVTAAVLAGAHIVRVHAVGEMAQVMRVAEAIRKGEDDK